MYNNLMIKRKRYVKVSGIVRREGKHYTAWCPELDVSTFGDSVDEASRNLGDAVELYLDTIDEMGEAEEILSGKGLKSCGELEPSDRVYLTSWDAAVRA